ncbi:hypothetical protein B0H14DRAFT_2646596 [Mycena olivaceomarginata]|nr:hypothetical protein B0H14DRAFT_2646596 [Mycena olivaceomarginata]
METTLHLCPGRASPGPLPSGPRRSSNHGRNAMQVDTDMPSPHTPRRLHNPIPRRQRPRLLQTPAKSRPCGADLRWIGNTHRLEVAAGTPSADGGSVLRGPGRWHDTDRGSSGYGPASAGAGAAGSGFEASGGEEAPHISGSNNVAIGNRQPSASSIDEGRYPCLPPPVRVLQERERRGVGDEDEEDPTWVVWYDCMHYRDSYRPDNGPDTEAGRYGSPRLGLSENQHRIDVTQTAKAIASPTSAVEPSQTAPSTWEYTICGTIGRNDTLGGLLTMVQQMEPSLNAIGIRLPVNRLIAVTVHPVACPAAPGPIGRHRHRRRAIGVFSPLCTGGSIGTQTAATWPTQNCLVARADSY